MLNDQKHDGPMPMRFGAAAALLLTLFLISGCGGSSASDQTAKFKQGFVPVVDRFRDTSRAIGTAIQQASSQTDAQIATEFGRLAARWQSQVSQLGTLKPPSNMASDFNALSSAATRAEADLKGIVAAAGTHSKSAATHAAASLVNDISSAKSASTAITDKLGVK
jgi:transcription initiation factor TFIID subunit TAF12